MKDASALTQDREMIAEARYEKFQLAGDIILVCTPGKVPLNQVAQFALSRAPARFTHVLLCVMPGLYLESMPGSGVHLIAAESAEGNFPAIYGEDWKVVRNKRLANDHETRSKISTRALYYVGQAYNGVFAVAGMLSPLYQISHSFCSELLARIFADLGYPITDQPPHTVLPVHIDLATNDQSGWQDVTENYRRYLAGEIRPSAFETLLDERFSVPDVRVSFIKMAKTFVEGAAGQASLIRAMQDLHSQVQLLIKAIPSMKPLELQNLATKWDMNLRSFKQSVASVVDFIFQLDRSLLNQRAQQGNEQSGEALHWILTAAGPVPDTELETMLSSCHQCLEVLWRTDTMILPALIDAARAVAIAAATVNLLPTDRRQEFQSVIINGIKSMRDMLSGSLRYDNYSLELEEVNADLKQRLASQSLASTEAITLFTALMKQLQWRRHFESLDITNLLQKLEASPTDYDLAYSIYARLLTAETTIPSRPAAP